MAFTKGINKIYESIRKQPVTKRNSLFESFKNDVIASKGLAFKYSLVESVKKYEGRLSESQANNLIAFLNKKYATQLNEGYAFKLEENKLFEKYGIQTVATETTSIDRIVSGKSLNEAAIKSVVVNPNIKSVKDYVLEQRDYIKESFKAIKNKKNIRGLNEQILVIERLASFLNDEDKKFITECLAIVKENVYQDFDKAVNRAYKLKIVSKKLFKESQEEMIFEDEMTDEINAINKKVETGLNAQYSGNTVPLEHQFNFLQNVTIDVPKNINTALNIEMFLPVYPLGYYLAERTVELDEIRRKLLSTKAVILNKFIYQKGLTQFELHNTIFEVDLTTNISDADFKKMDYTLKAKINIYLGLKQVLSEEEIKPLVTGILTDYENYLPNVIPDQITPIAQQEEFAGKTEGRNKNYMKHNASTKYYKDNRGGALDDSYTDDVFSGTADESDVAARMDKKFYGDSSKKAADDENALMDDDEFDKMFYNKHKGKKKPENEFFDDEDDY